MSTRTCRPLLRLLLVALALIALPVLAPAKPRERPAGAALAAGELDAVVTRAMRAFEVPGIAVAVVKDGQTIVARGWGLRRLGHPGAVDAATRFAIASNTKAFTCVALSILVEEGRLSWDDPVTRHLPWFAMHDPWVSRELTVLDLVTHRSGLGLGQGDLMWWPPTDFSRRQIVEGMRHLRPASSLRTRYAYNNVAYVAAGEVVSAVSGQPWEQFVAERILRPLGMSQTGLEIDLEAGTTAWPHLRQEEGLRPVVPLRFDNAAPAAGLSSTAADLARWTRMLVECSRGQEKPAGQVCVLKPESIRRLWTAALAMAPSDPPPGFEALRANFAGYGLGFGVRDQRGRLVATHTGGLPGYLSRLALVPEERLAVVVLTNQEASGAFDAIVQTVLDRYLGAPAPPVDWVAAYRRRAEEERSAAEAVVAKARAARDPASRPSLRPSGYVGRYRDAWYGEASVGVEGERLVLSMSRTPEMVADLEHWQHDTFVARWRRAFMGIDQPADAFVSFALLPDGSIDCMALSPVSPAIDFSFDYQDLLFRPAGAGGRRQAQ